MTRPEPVIRASDWAESGGQLLPQLREFLEVYEQRPIDDNAGGVSEVGGFTLWYILKRLEPELVVEVGVWKGQTSWLIEMARPGAELICFDPNRKIRVYESDSAAYPVGDFAAHRLEVKDPQTAVVFFDDHQDAVKRLCQARRKGFVHLIFDDNYPVGAGSHRSLSQALARSDGTSEYLETVIDTHCVFPPLFAHDEPITAERVKIGIPPLELPDNDLLRPFKEQMPQYRWMTYVKLKSNPQLSARMKFLEWRNRRL